jgi:glycosyltransferase involved in cell wall biosynthesis
LTCNSYAHKEGSIELVIASILNQQFSDMEIIIADNSPVPDLRYKSILEESNIPYDIISTNNSSIGMARNMGASRAIGDTLVFIDDDTMMCSQNALKKINIMHNKFSHGYGAKRFWTYPPRFFEENKREYLNKIKDGDFRWLLNPKRAILPMNIDRKSGLVDLYGFTFPGNFCYVDTKLFKKIGGFDSRFEKYGWEDDYLGFCLYDKDPRGFANLGSLKVLHVNHPFQNSEQDVLNNKANFTMYQNILNQRGVGAFNINVLFGLPNKAGEEVIEYLK